MAQPDDPDPNESSMPSFEGGDELPEDTDLTVIKEGNVAGFFLSRLMDRALREDPEDGYPAFRKLISLLSDQLSRFEVLCRYNHEVCEHLAPKLEMWPSLYHAHPELRRKTEERLRMFKLGKAAWINTSGKSFSFGTPAIKIVVQLLRVTQSARGYPDALHDWGMQDIPTRPEGDVQRAQFDRWMSEVAPALPDLARDTWKEWAEKTHELFKLLYGEEYQNRPELSEIARQVTETDKKGAISRGRQRSAIKKSLQQAWKTVSGSGVDKD